MTPGTEHPVWQLYDQLKTARLNALYYSARLAALKKANRRREAVGTGLSSISALAGVDAIFKATGFGSSLLLYFLVPAAVLAIYQKLRDPADELAGIERHAVAWRQAYTGFLRLKGRVEDERSYTESLRRAFRDQCTDLADLVDQKFEKDPDATLQRTCYDQVNRELPAEAFYVPDE